MLSLRIGFEKTNNGVREKGLSCLPSNKKLGKFHFYHYLLCFTNFERISPPCPGVKRYQLNAILCQPLSLSLDVRAHRRAEARIGSRTIIVLPEFDGRGAALSILEFLCFVRILNWG
jgi:hypothetical protein